MYSASLVVFLITVAALYSNVYNHCSNGIIYLPTLPCQMQTHLSHYQNTFINVKDYQVTILFANNE